MVPHSTSQHGSPPRLVTPAGAYGCTISGAGPTAIAVVDDPNTGARVGQAMADAFVANGLGVNTISVVRLDEEGARLL
jgi:homoserine kinase